MSWPRLVADVGGTNARFAMQLRADAELEHLAVTPSDRHGTLRDAIRSYLAEQQLPAPRSAAIGIANPVTGDQVSMTNHDWSFSISELQAALGLDRLLVLNDFAVLALALPKLRAEDLRQIGGGTAGRNAPLAVIGAGTGLGMAGLLPAAAGRFIAVAGEGGHGTLAAADEFEDRIVARLRTRFGHASAERALSGPGLENLHEACAALAGEPAPLLAAPEITRRALAGEDALCQRAVELFFSFLGTEAGNLALTLGARGGVYISGGVTPRLLPLMEASPFRRRFEAKGRFARYLQPIPTWVIDSEFSPGLIGAAVALDQAE